MRELASKLHELPAVLRTSNLKSGSRFWGAAEVAILIVTLAIA